MDMRKPGRLQEGDRVALVSLSSGMAGEDVFRYRYEIGRQRLQEEFGLQAVAMPHALRGIDYLDRHPQARADDLLQAFADPAIRAVISIIGGDDSIRLLPYIDFSAIRQNPKIFLGYSDATVSHFMMRRAGVVSFYGPCILAEFAENAGMHPYTVQALRDVLFAGRAPLPVEPSPYWTSEHLDWTDARNQTVPRAMQPERHGYELLQGAGTVFGPLIGGCVDVFPMLLATSLWPAVAEWDGAVLFLETSEEQPHPNTLKYLLRGLAAQGILSRINGILFGKPIHEQWYAEYKEVLCTVVGRECGRPELPILYNLPFGHTAPICTLPCGVPVQIDCAQRSLTILESGVA